LASGEGPETIKINPVIKYLKLSNVKNTAKTAVCERNELLKKSVKFTDFEHSS
jgi:hypothetical protein